jgi:hypothetical protein
MCGIAQLHLKLFHLWRNWKTHQLEHQPCVCVDALYNPQQERCKDTTIQGTQEQNVEVHNQAGFFTNSKYFQFREDNLWFICVRVQFHWWSLKECPLFCQWGCLLILFASSLRIILKLLLLSLLHWKQKVRLHVWHKSRNINKLEQLHEMSN